METVVGDNNLVIPQTEDSQGTKPVTWLEWAGTEPQIEFHGNIEL